MSAILYSPTKNQLSSPCQESNYQIYSSTHRQFILPKLSVPLFRRVVFNPPFLLQEVNPPQWVWFHFPFFCLGMGVGGETWNKIPNKNTKLQHYSSGQWLLYESVVDLLPPSPPAGLPILHWVFQLGTQIHILNVSKRLAQCFSFPTFFFLKKKILGNILLWLFYSRWVRQIYFPEKVGAGKSFYIAAG